ncbi:MAG TPA: 2-C-methyl-D-erythritol 2,4-cyclodiphosphate synthase [Acidimicrobiia bacterium]|jgi:2-C-methyl-D-erythritol 2,4-cyclodiphosphate synthase|nr:2-C-methyl-D-erythritol 2,4-cyclodiphosphate synthase [Acidimicrobiia bacterium]
MRTRVGNGYDIHPFGGNGPLVLGGVTLDGPGLAGHSDADAVAHAVADAVLGASGLPDLGTLFPASDDRWQGASSIELLRDVAQRVRAAGWWIGNVDVVIAAEIPRLAPHLDAIVANLRDALTPAAEPLGDGIHVSVKPKRGEGIGAIGRSEGIAVWAVALLDRG